jgi:uncharacterized protein (TIGR00730 family)
MYELSEAFVTLPGGIGTYDETIEVLTWRQLGLHDKPILICDVAGSAAPLVQAIDAAIAGGFADASVRGLFKVTEGAVATLDALLSLPARPNGSAAPLL